MDVDLRNPRALRVRLYPDKKNKETEEKWKRWLGCARVTYNSALLLWTRARAEGRKPNRGAIKTEVTKAERVTAAGKGWLAETPMSIRGDAVNELWKNVKSAIAGREARNAKKKDNKNAEKREKPLGMKPKRKSRWGRESVTLETGKMDFQAGPPSHVSIFGDVVRYRDSRQVTDFLAGLAKRTDRPLKTKAQAGTRYNKDCRLMLDRRTRAWWLLVPYDADELELPRVERARKRRNDRRERKEWVALDPGVRVKATFYSPQGVAGEIGADFKDCTRCAAEKYVALQAKWARLVAKGRKKMNKAEKRQASNARRGMARCHAKLEAVRRHHHYVAVNYLLDNYAHVLVPTFPVGEMAQKTNPRTGRKRAIRRATVKDMMAYGHYQFRKRLESRGGPDRVFPCLENHTTMTCGLCLTQNRNVGASKVFRCVSETCGLVAGRDVHAARNILLKHVLLPSPQPPTDNL